MEHTYSMYSFMVPANKLSDIWYKERGDNFVTFCVAWQELHFVAADIE